MKKTLILLFGVAVVLSVGLAYADEGMQWTDKPAGTLTYDRDSMLYTLDPSSLAYDSVVRGAGGSAGGGIGENPDSLIFTLDPSSKPVHRIEAAGVVGGFTGDRDSMLFTIDPSSKPIK